MVQLGLLAAFAGAPWFGAPLVQGSLASSLWFGSLILSDPLVVLQSLLAGHPVAMPALLGAAAVALPCMLLAGRLYCGWVCPINLVSDGADALRRALGWRAGVLPRADRRLRPVVLALVLGASALSGTVAWEVVNPITQLVRGPAFGLWTGAAFALASVLLLDLLLLRHGWCGTLCPVGAFYGALGQQGRLYVQAVRAERCTHCGDCFDHCPEPQVIAPVLRAQAPTLCIVDTDCLRCGRCIDQCAEGVFAWRLGAAGRRRS